jgi:hypothetical protein
LIQKYLQQQKLMFGSTLYLQKSISEHPNREFKSIEDYDNGELDELLT